MFYVLPDVVAEFFEGSAIDLELSLEGTFSCFEGGVFLQGFIHG